jgi:hypothetical protein
MRSWNTWPTTSAATQSSEHKAYHLTPAHQSSLASSDTWKAAYRSTSITPERCNTSNRTYNRAHRQHGSHMASSAHVFSWPQTPPSAPAGFTTAPAPDWHYGSSPSLMSDPMHPLAPDKMAVSHPMSPFIPSQTWAHTAEIVEVQGSDSLAFARVMPRILSNRSGQMNVIIPYLQAKLNTTFLLLHRFLFRWLNGRPVFLTTNRVPVNYGISNRRLNIDTELIITI